METKIDWQAFNRLDQGIVMDFISSAAGAIHEGGQLSFKDINELRAALTAHHQIPKHTSLVDHLAQNHSDFLSILCNRFGEVGLSQNLLKVRLRPIVDELEQTLARTGDELLRKAQIFFNWPFYVYLNQECQHQTLLSSHIVGFATKLRQILETVDVIKKNCLTMHPSYFAPMTEEDFKTDKLLAKYLGFSEVDRSSEPFAADRDLRKLYSTLIDELTVSVQQFCQQLQANDFEIPPVTFSLIEWLDAESNRISKFSFPNVMSLNVWELRGHNICTVMKTVNSSIENLSERVIQSLNQNQPQQTHQIFTKAMERRLVWDLNKRGASIKVATEAAHQLRQYLRQQNVDLRSLIPQELERIHSALSEANISAMEPSSFDQLGLNYSELKKDTMESMTSLSQYFQHLITIATLLALMVFQSGCGVKRPPVSDIEDLRPEIPFRVSEIEDEANPKDDLLPTKAKTSMDETKGLGSPTKKTGKPNEIE